MDINGSLRFIGTGTLKNAVAETFADTTARDTAIPSPRAGQLVYLTTGTKYQYYNGSSWQDFSVGNVDTLDELSDVTITGSAAGQVLYSTGVNTWVNGAIGATSGVQAYDAGLTSIAGLTTAADKMIYTTASDTYAVTDLTSFARTLLDDTTQGAMQTTLGLVPGTNVQAYDVELAALAGLTSAADQLPYFTGSGTAALTTLTTFGRSLIDDADASAARTTLGLVIGTNVQAYDAFLLSIATLGTAADKMIYTTAADTAAETTLTAFARSILDDADEATFKATVNLEIGVDVQAYDADLGVIAGLSSADGNFIVGSATGWVVESGATARASLGLSIGTDVQGYDAGLASLATGGTGIVSMNGDTVAFRSITSSGTTITITNADGTAGDINVDLPNVGTAVTAQFVKITTDNQGRVSATTPVVTGDITALVGSTYVDVIGDTMTGNLTMSGAGVQVILPNAPTAATHATNKQYVDNLVTAGTVWRAPIVGPDLIDVVTSVPGSPVASTTYIAYGGSYPQTWGTITDVAQNDVLTRNAADTDWIRIDTLAAGDRFIITAEHGTFPITSALYTAGFRRMDLIEYVSGAPTAYASWSKAHVSNYQTLQFTVNKVAGDNTGLADSTQYYFKVKLNAGALTEYSVTTDGTGPHTFNDLIGLLNTALTGVATVTIADGHLHFTGGASTDVIVLDRGTTGTDLFTSLTNFNQIHGSVEEGTTVLDNDPDSLHYGHTYTFSTQNDRWAEIAGPGSIGAGVGLVYSGSTLNINLGAGITQLPSDEVGLDVDSGKAVQLTSTATGGLLTFVLDGSTMSQSASGLKIASGGVTGTELNASVAGAGLAGGGGSALSVNVDNSSIEIATDTLQVKAAGITNAMLAGSIAAGKLTVGDGLFIVGNVSNIGVAVTPTGDVTFNNTGVFAIASGVIVNADINASAAIDFSKLATLASANILVGSAGGVATSVAMSGDVTISNTGVTAIGASKVTNAMLVNSSVTLAGDTGSDAVALGETLTVTGGAAITTSVAANAVTVDLDITGLTNSLTSGTLDAADLFVVHDASVPEIKKITAGNLADFIGAATSLPELSDVDDATVATTSGHVLVANGTAWINKKIFHTEAKTSATSWVVTHNLGQKFCNVTVCDSTDQVIIPDSITFDSTTQLTVTFNVAVAGQVMVSGVA